MALNEQATEKFYDDKDELYRSFWSKTGQLSWGKFSNHLTTDVITPELFEQACQHMTACMAEAIALNQNTVVLDAGCGNGITSIWLAKTFQTQVIGIDLSQIRIQNAQQLLQQHSDLKVQFIKSSLCNIDLPDNSVTHIFSQASLYHIHDITTAFKEMHRVLMPGGYMVFDDLIKPTEEISDQAKHYVYDRLLFDTSFNFTTYQTHLEHQGWQILEAEDLSEHLALNYRYLSQRTEQLSQQPSTHQSSLSELSTAYREMVKAIENDELGWAYYLCQKRGDDETA